LDENGNKITYTSSPNNETYLCSWLYKKDHESNPVWLDRYYYPDLIERHEALKSESNYSQSFENIIDKNYIKGETINLNDKITGKIHRNTYFDKLSDTDITNFGISRDFETLRTGYTNRGMTCK
jgi:hypothetical protein